MTSTPASSGTSTPSTPSTPVRPCLWFDTDLQQVIDLYASVFPDTVVHSLEQQPVGGTTIAELRLGGLEVQAFRAGARPVGFTMAMSLSITCDDQAEVDRIWAALTADGGEESQCGWLQDRFGVSWQVVPRRLHDLLADPDPARARATAEALYRMQRIVVADLEAAADAAGPGAA